MVAESHKNIAVNAKLIGMVALGSWEIGLFTPRVRSDIIFPPIIRIPAWTSAKSNKNLTCFRNECRMRAG